MKKFYQCDYCSFEGDCVSTMEEHALEVHIRKDYAQYRVTAQFGSCVFGTHGTIWEAQDFNSTQVINAIAPSKTATIDIALQHIESFLPHMNGQCEDSCGVLLNVECDWRRPSGKPYCHDFYDAKGIFHAIIDTLKMWKDGVVANRGDVCHCGRIGCKPARIKCIKPAIGEFNAGNWYACSVLGENGYRFSYDCGGNSEGFLEINRISPKQIANTCI